MNPDIVGDGHQPFLVGVYIPIKRISYSTWDDPCVKFGLVSYFMTHEWPILEFHVTLPKLTVHTSK